MFRALAKTSIACAYSWSGAARWSSGVDATAMPFIAGYHRVVENFDQSARQTIPSMLISSATFEKHLDWLAKRFSLVSFDEIGAHLENNRRFSRPAAAITFDDGYADVYHNAFPILKRKGIPAAVFVVTKLIGTSQPQIHDRLYMYLTRQKPDSDPLPLMTSILARFPQKDIVKRIEAFESEHPHDSQRMSELAPLSWEMIWEMDGVGITIGSHTKSHTLLTSESRETAKKELVESRHVLQLRLKKPVQHFAYPDGRCNPAMVEIVKAAGYRFAYTICGWRDSRYPLLTIPRKVLWERAACDAMGRFSGAVMDCHVHRVFDAKGVCEHDHGL